MDALAIVNSELQGRSLSSVERREFDWCFCFGEGRVLAASCPWRVLAEKGIAASSQDDGHQFGLPAPVNAEARVWEIVADKTIDSIAITDGADLSINFKGGVVLQFVNLSMGYEPWHMTLGKREMIAWGGGEIALMGPWGK